MQLHSESLLQQVDSPRLADFLQNLPWPELLSEKLNQNISVWQKAIEDVLQMIPPGTDIISQCDAETVRLSNSRVLSAEMRNALRHSLRTLMPWRKGPFDFFGIRIDTEWRSDLKWARLEQAIQPLPGRQVLDIGCGSGYHLWRMLGGGAKSALGLEPYFLSVMQFLLFKKYQIEAPNLILPLRLEDFPQNLACFDTVFSMGLFYHQRSPFDHLFHLRSLLRPGAELVLETLVIEGADGQVLVPDDRYAKMRNVWFIPTTLTLESWLKRSGFKNINLIDVSRTTSAEQRRTEWMEYESLADFLDPIHPEKTVEGYPAPVRAIFTASL